MDRFAEGNIVKHFKRETLSNKEMESNKYLYQIKGFAIHTETGEKLVIYQALYHSFKTYARPIEIFFGEVDREKYPNIKQRFRFVKT